MTGKIMALAILLCAAVAGGVLYYLQVYGFYDQVADDGAAVQVTLRDGAGLRVLDYAGFQAIDAESSPIRYRACFTVADPGALVDMAQVVDNPQPRNAPGWFDCFDAEAIAAELAAGTATAYLGRKNVHYGVDRIVAITADGRGYAWHDLNDCGRKAYDGTVVGEECPPRPGTN
ncbi:MAG: histidine kinase [Rhodobacteraceae bacterium]|nr:MAG: histidine kinase [Paracoccaceae bacterium]